jgi:hypothetical protein
MGNHGDLNGPSADDAHDDHSRMLESSYKGNGSKSPQKAKTIFGKSPKKERPTEGGEFEAWDEDEVSNGSFVKNTELELLRVNQRMLSLENKLSQETL